MSSANTLVQVVVRARYVSRVKCDEGKPTCSRCEKFGIACDGYLHQSRTPSPRSRSQGPRLAPRIRTPSLPSVSRSPLGSIFGTDDGEDYFSVFQNQTSFQMTPFFDSESFRMFILQSCGVPSIRHLVMAIGALAKSCMTPHQHKIETFESINAAYKAHHGTAIQEYSKALNLMRQASSHGRQDLRTTLTGSLLIACFEGAHGNFFLADAQIESGLNLLGSWRRAQTPVGYTCSSFSSPVTDEVDDILIQAFRGLEIQSSLFGTKYTTHQHRSMMYEGEDDVQDMPVLFTSYQMAQTYLELIVRRLLHWMYSAELSGNQGTGRDIHITDDKCVQEQHTEDKSLYHFTVQGVEQHSNLQLEYIHYFSQLERWNTSFESFLRQSQTPGRKLTSNLLYLGSKACVLLMNTVVGKINILPGQDRANIEDIVQLSRAVFEGLQVRSMTHFTVLHGSIDPSRLAEILHDPSRQSRIDAIGILLRWPREEGTSSSICMGQAFKCAQLTKANKLSTPGTPDEMPQLRESATQETLGKDLYAMEVAYQDFLIPDEITMQQRRRTIS
ncbi:uncharacterized protein RSE6_04039 [Rhynchosporium secalis]|uniref:Zn(2)-C6 fungal-type domain-containing protein n=1 Tax=Rhynchosporium secalis TaxID=38038 RepID=A0A1E1M495_RHYSE|nr:uncharacterized protein RSE6_04039 [Rhynchosporium secalis]